MVFSQPYFSYSYAADEADLHYHFIYNYKDGDLNPPSRSKFLSENIKVSKLR